MPAKLKFAAVAVAMTLALGLTACGPAGSTPNAGASQQKTLIYGASADADILDPSKSYSLDAGKIITNIVESLVSYTMDGDKFVAADGGLAESWDVSDDSLTYTFHLRKGVKFQDGTPFDADAVVYNFERVRNNAEDFPFYPALFDGHGDQSNIKKTEALDENTVEITLGHPDIYFLNSIASFQMAIVSPKAVEAGTIDEHPVGTGPFEFVEWKKNDTITLKKFDGYWRKGFPKLDEVIYKVIADPTARATALKTGEVDLIGDINSTDVEDIQKDDDLTVQFRPSLNGAWLGLNSQIAPFDNLDVRKAMNYAINTEEIVKNFYNGDSTAAITAIPPVAIGSGGYESPYSYDPKKAKELLAKAGHPNGFSIDLWAPSVARAYMSNPPKVAEYIQKNLAEVGITAKIVSYDWATYSEKINRGTEAGAFILGGTGADGAATGLWNFQWRSTAMGDHNRYGYYSDEFDAALRKVQTATDEEQLLANLKSAQDILFRDAPYVPIAHSTPPVAHVKGLQGLIPFPNGEDHLTEVTISKD